MFNSKKLFTTITTSLCLMSVFIVPSVQASLITTTPTSIISVSVDGDAKFAGVVDSDALSATEVIARERAKLSQESKRIATFLDFDLSYLTASNVNASGFSALFSLDFVSRLNGKNNLTVLLGQVESAWSDAAGSLPLFEYAQASSNQKDLVSNVKIDAFGTFTVDVTGIVQGWVNGVQDNNGLVVFGESTVFQGAGFNNPSLIVNVPAPTTIAILGLALVGLSLSRRVKK